MHVDTVIPHLSSVHALQTRMTGISIFGCIQKVWIAKEIFIVYAHGFVNVTSISYLYLVAHMCYSSYFVVFFVNEKKSKGS